MSKQNFSSGKLLEVSVRNEMEAYVITTTDVDGVNYIHYDPGSGGYLLIPSLKNAAVFTLSNARILVTDIQASETAPHQIWTLMRVSSKAIIKAYRSNEGR